MALDATKVRHPVHRFRFEVWGIVESITQLGVLETALQGFVFQALYIAYLRFS